MSADIQPSLYSVHDANIFPSIWRVDLFLCLVSFFADTSFTCVATYRASMCRHCFSISRSVTILWNVLRNYEILCDVWGLYLRITSTKIKTTVNTSIYEVYQKKIINMLQPVKLSLLSPTPYLIFDQVYFGCKTIYRRHFLIYLKTCHVTWKREWLL